MINTRKLPKRKALKTKHEKMKDYMKSVARSKVKSMSAENIKVLTRQDGSKNYCVLPDIVAVVRMSH